MIVLSVFLLLSCLAIPIAYCKVKQNNTKANEKGFKMPFGIFFSYLSFYALSYLLIECGTLPILLSLIASLAFFLLYCIAQYRNLSGGVRAILSAWSIFAYMLLAVIFGYFQTNGGLSPVALVIYLVLLTINFKFLINQKSYHK